MSYSAPEGCSVSQYNTLLAEQESTIREQIMQDFALESVYLNTIAGDTIDNVGKGEDIRTLVQNRVSTAWSRTVPEFQRSVEMCQVRPDADAIGQTEYTTRMETLIGESPKICVEDSRHGVRNSLTAAYDAMKQAIRELMDYDTRAQYLLRSGVKFNANSTLARTQRFTGGRKQIGTAFNDSVLPDSGMSYLALINTIQYARNVLGVKMFGSGNDEHALVVAGFNQVEKFRQEGLVNNAILAQTQGGYADGNDSIKRLQWTDIQHRGIRLNVDSEPLRFNDWDQDGMPDLIAPTIEVSSDHGVDADINPAWETANYEIGFIVFKDAFKRVVPTRYTGEGQWRFAPQFTMGELVWHNVKDNVCNVRGDTGFFWYRVSRAIQAVSPHSVIPFAYKICNLDDGLEPCDSISS